jgi:hypothetical protein
VVACLALALVVYFFSNVSEGVENCGDSCASASSVAAMRWLAVGLVVTAIGLAAVAMTRSWPVPAVRVHCYACGDTTEVRAGREAEDLEAAGWVTEQGRTFCAGCAAARDE